MPQVFEVNATIDIPPSLIVIERNEYDKLLKSSLKGRWWSLNDVMQRISISQKSFSDKVLNNPRFQNELSEFTRFPKEKGERYYFLASKMENFLEENFKEIMKDI
ncbi:DUF771 domain-containing protein [Macrococcoides caseolyticum]|nr:DUF771 domain-containing protein [Macrococcus caseolyticus]RKO12962.1 DUF771 domain-containing protein [Macrococcus caseolyticus]